MVATLTAVNVRMPKDVPWHGRTVYTGVYKHTVSGPRMVRRLNIDGDGQGDLGGHGGEQRAVLVYQLDSYRFWAKQLGRDDLTPGQFGDTRQQVERALRIPALSPGWQGSMRTLLDQSDGEDRGSSGSAGLSTADTALPPAWPGFRPLTVARIQSESRSVFSLHLAAADGSELPTALPGQFLTVKVQPEGDVPPLVRSYSLSGRPGAGTFGGSFCGRWKFWEFKEGVVVQACDDSHTWHQRRHRSSHVAPDRRQQLSWLPVQASEADTNSAESRTFEPRGSGWSQVIMRLFAKNSARGEVVWSDGARSSLSLPGPRSCCSLA
ncbi:3-alpha domain-containing protein [Streptomyces sp. NBC_01589]|uniref:3-alpha domain-containing protein n=1 Tax=unclassified Streptomyces TaxID=2593676 RepID=UPI0038702B7F